MPRPHTRADHIAPGALLGGMTGIFVGMVWGVRACDRSPGCMPGLGHLAGLLGGSMAGFGIGGAVGAVGGEVSYVIRHRRF